MSVLPPNWSMSTIGAVCSHPQYGWTTSAAETGEVRLLRTTDITSGDIDWTTVPLCCDAPADVEKYLLADGDIVVSRAGSVGKSLLISDPERAVFASYLIRFRPRISARYVAHFLNSGAYWKQITEQTAGIAIPNVNASKLREIRLPVAPAGEQDRIVSKIDELFSRVDEGERALEHVQTLVERYRQSVLKAAVTGELTREWRERNKDQVESGEALLARILEARREAWEKAEVEKMRAKGVTPASDKWKEKYEEPPVPDVSTLPELPDGWTWAALSQLSWTSSYGTSQKCDYTAKGVAVLRIPNIRRGQLNYEDMKYAMTDLELENEAELREGDLLVVRTNGSESLIGVGSVLLAPLPYPCYFASYLIRFRLVLPGQIGEWINFCWQSHIVRDFVHRRKATSAGQFNVSQSSLMEICLPIPPRAEMRAIVDGLQQIFSKSDNAVASVRSQLLHSRGLRQAALNAAFAGLLTAQDPLDEPAAMLLARIVDERETSNASVIRTRRANPCT